MQKKKQITVILLLLMCAALGTGIYAYMTSHKVKVNRLTVGENVIKTEEEFPNPEIKPGGSIKKVVEIKNTGSVPCFVRAMILFSNNDAEDISTLELNTKDWSIHQDGYYYYKHILPTDQSTIPLMSAVHISDNEDIENLEDFDIHIYSESVQADGYKEGEYLEAFKSLVH